MKAIEIESVCKRFGGLQAVNDVSLSVEQGERLAIIGPNGAGKTTLMNLLGGSYACDSGEIRIFDRNITRVPDYRRIEFGLARTFQLTSIFFDLSVLDNILLAVQATKPYRLNVLHYQKSYADLLDESRLLLEKWDLWEKRNIPVKRLSYGEQRKVELILGLASNPRILLLDEPTSGLSEAESSYLAELISGIGKQITLVIVEHDMDVVFTLASKIAVLNYGSLLMEGTPKEIAENAAVREIYLGAKAVAAKSEI